MFFIMILSGLLSTMNMWADKLDDVRFSINDAYMILLMTGWMFLFMGLIDGQSTIIFIGGLLVAANLWCIRTQFLVSEAQYNSMAVHMSKRLLEKKNNIQPFLHHIIDSQEKEILFMKNSATKWLNNCQCL